MASAPANRPHSFDIPRAEDDLAEWASRIKAMQRQVDEDDQAEQRKLEEEIAKSRMKRLRRSQMYASRPGTPDLAASASSQSLPASEDTASESPADRRQAQEDALQKLTGSTPDSLGKTSLSQTQTVSLASFIGGTATGPRLNKPVAQPNAHDPMQFQQPSDSSPHPVFGRGGVAMPGMVSRHKSPAPPPDAQEQPRLAPASRENERRRSTPAAIARRVPESIEEAEFEPERDPYPAARARSKSRDRHISMPVEAPVMRAVTPTSRAKSPAAPRNVTGPARFDETSTARLAASRGIPTRTTSPAAVATTTPPSTTRSPAHRYSTPPAPSRSPVSIPGLARPVQSSSPRSSNAYNPPSTQATAPSVAFLRAPTEKAPTPSLSRLKGRGFVQNMVRTSTELEASAGYTSPGAAEKAQPPVQKKASVLDRWPGSQQPSPPPMDRAIPVRPVRHSMYGDTRRPVIPAIQPMRTGVSSSSSTSFAMPKPTPVADAPLVTHRLARKKSLPQIVPEELEPARPATPPRSDISSHPADEPRPQLNKKKSFSSEPPPLDSVNAKTAPGLGSSNTLISYIKPMKTGDNPITASSPPPTARPKTPVAEPVQPSRAKTPSAEATQSVRTNFPPPGIIQPFRAKTPVREVATPSQTSAVHMDEFGMRSSAASKPLSGALAPAAPLAHPTRSRAKKPKKAPEAARTVEPAPAAAPNGLSAQAPIVRDYASSSASSLRSIAEESSKPPSTPSPRTSRLGENRADQASASVLAPKPRKTPDNLGSGRPTGRPLPSTGASSSPIAFPPSAPSPVDERPSKHERTPTNDHTPPSRDRPPTHERAPSTPRQRIPSTGSRATVMDVAQTFSQIRDNGNGGEAASPAAASPTVPSPSVSGLPESSPPTASPVRDVFSEEPPAPVVSSPSPVLSPKPRPTVPAMGRRTSSYDRYSVALPPLKEETPTSSPAGSLNRSSKRPSLIEEESAPSDKNSKRGHVQEPTMSDEGERHFDVVNLSTLSPFKIDNLVNLNIAPWSPPSDITCISTEVMIVAGNNTTVVAKDTHILYDTEIVVIIQRNKSKSKGLVTTNVWGWVGKNASLGDKENKKLHDLAKRYGTSLSLVQQYFEPADFVYAVGNQLAVRQGTRAHWTAENTAMHLIRSVYGAVFMDEYDLSILNLCSAYSYCLSILDTIYVWHGRGSTPAERKAAMSYAADLSTSGNIAELFEGVDDDDEMFWMILGSDDYAKADHWRWRSNTTASEPKLWRYDSSLAPHPFTFMTAVPSVVAMRENVWLVDCYWECYVLVGQNARGKRQDIATVMQAAKQLSLATATSKPFRPPVHVVNLPSQLPLDLRVAFRGLDETLLNDGEIPDHMNLLHQATAAQHLRKDSWMTVALRDHRMLPLGIHPTMLT